MTVMLVRQKMAKEDAINKEILKEADEKLRRLTVNVKTTPSKASSAVFCTIGSVPPGLGKNKNAKPRSLPRPKNYWIP
jgi:hypothetical protein